MANLQFRIVPNGEIFYIESEKIIDVKYCGPNSCKLLLGNGNEMLVKGKYQNLVARLDKFKKKAKTAQTIVKSMLKIQRMIPTIVPVTRLIKNLVAIYL